MGNLLLGRALLLGEIRYVAKRKNNLTGAYREKSQSQSDYVQVKKHWKWFRDKYFIT